MAREGSEYERQYEEDMERAQALSLESLALEQFKNKRLQELNDISKTKSVSVCRASSMSESDSNKPKYDRQLSKSRPRPGTSSGRSNSLIAPPPQSMRKNSSAQDSPDLISFVNPTTTASSDIVQFCQNYNTAYSQMTVFQPNVYTAPVQQQQVWFKQMPANGGYQSPVQTPRTVYRPPCTFPQIPQINSQLNQAPALPPKNQHRTPPALVLPSSKSSLRQQQKPSNLLIDLVAHPDDRNSVRVSILQEFDPILSESEESMRNLSPDSSMDDSESVYDEYDPYDIYTGSGNNSLSDPLYAAVVRSETAPQSPPPAPPPRAHRMGVATEGVAKVDLVSSVKRVEGHNCNKRDSDLRAFYQMVYDVRKKFRHNDPDTNMGLVISPLVDYQYKDETSIKLCVYPDFEGADVTKPITFTCDVTCSVEHVTLQLICDLEAPVKDKYTLKVWGCCEYLVPTTLLSDYEYVHNCIKLEEDVVLTLIPDSKVDRSFARTLQDDVRDKELTFEDVVSCDSATYISYEQLSILVETVESEIKKLEEAAVQMENFNNPSTIPGMQPQAVVQTVKYVINMMGGLCPLDIMEAVEHLQQICKNFLPYRDNSTITEAVRSTCNRIRLGIQNLIEIYSRAFKVDFEVTGKTATSEATKYVPDLQDSLLVRICAIYRPNVEWKHDSYIVAAQIYHGMRPIGHPVLSPPSVKTEDGSWPARINFDYWFQMVDVPICSLARESRLVLVVYGRTLEAPEGDSSNAPQYKQEEIGWAAVQFFDYEGVMIQGNRVLSIWPREAQFVQGPAPPAGTHPHSDHPMLDIQITGLFRVEFPSLPPDLTIGSQSAPFDSLDSQTQRQLTEICEQDMLHKLAPEVREVLWEKRHYLHHKPEALPKILLAAKSWEYACLPDLHGMAHAWTPPKPVEALQFLLPTFPDVEVRKLAVRWIGGLSNDELIDYIPQLVVALRHETYENSALAQFLLERALRSPRFAHHLFWLLSHTLPGSLPQNLPCENVTERDEVEVSEVRHHRRMKLMLRALLAVCGEALRSCFLSQQILVKELNDIASTVQKTKESHRITVLHNGLNGVHSNLSDNPTSLPLSPTLKVAGVQVHSSFYFPSNTLPLKISFLAPDESVIPAIYKVGDDLQQDMLTLQMVRLMDKLWLNKGLDLKMVSFVCVPTGKKKGMIEMVTNAETLRKIQVEHGLTGSFKDKPIAEWLAKHNPSELEYGRAVENFTASCAGYCVVTYILGICDRHNDNIMLKTSGHLFHIDFGKFLGDAQMFGNFKRDRAPFVLTSDMAYVINGGDRPSEKFHKFVDLCCQAFNIIRANCNLFLYLFTLMASSGICGVTPESVSYLHKALLPTMSNPEAAAYFARLIESSLKSWFTQFNFFLHNLAQLKFSSEHSEGALLSFVPKVYSVATDGRLVHVLVVSYKKRYDPDKYYVYVLRVYRESSKGHMEIQRTYKEFCELHQKLCIYFPLAKLHSLSTGLHVGRSNIKQVAQKRYREVSLFVTSLFKCADEIAHSDLVYTFFHPLLRDQQFEEYSKNRKSELKDEAGRLKGQLKLSFQFCKGSFNVMVYHARSLPLSSNGQEPSTYVKVYLLPDQNKSTKRKTKVVRRNCHPSFVEMLEYRMALEIIRERHLQATVWNYDPLQENEFLGGVDLELCNFDLTKETAEWYPLVNLSR